MYYWAFFHRQVTGLHIFFPPMCLFYLIFFSEFVLAQERSVRLTFLIPSFYLCACQDFLCQHLCIFLILWPIYIYFYHFTAPQLHSTAHTPREFGHMRLFLRRWFSVYTKTTTNPEVQQWETGWWVRMACVWHRDRRDLVLEFPGCANIHIHKEKQSAVCRRRGAWSQWNHEVKSTISVCRSSFAHCCLRKEDPTELWPVFLSAPWRWSFIWISSLSRADRFTSSPKKTTSPLTSKRSP